MKIAINKAHFPVTVLGPGRRIGIWLQGCRIHCPGCVSRDTWAVDPGRETTVARVLSWCRNAARTSGFDGVTISGGEPFDQPAALRALLDALIAWRASGGPGDFDILCYSGYPLRHLRRKHAAILERLDALIPEPFAAEAPQDRLWRGSANQTLELLSDRGRMRFADFVDAPAEAFGKRIQVGIDPAGDAGPGQDRVWFVGIPARGDMESLEKLCSDRGVTLAKVSWRQ
jgi:anaerobic ribonucleoside-triphosphate reductase activating protein